MGFGGDIYPRACLHARPVGISSRPIFGERSGRKHLDVPFLLVSSNDPLDGSAERDDFFGTDRHAYAAVSRGISKRPGSTVETPTLALKVQRPLLLDLLCRATRFFPGYLVLWILMDSLGTTTWKSIFRQRPPVVLQVLFHRQVCISNAANRISSKVST